MNKCIIIAFLATIPIYSAARGHDIEAVKKVLVSINTKGGWGIRGIGGKMAFQEEKRTTGIWIVVHCFGVKDISVRLYISSLNKIGEVPILKRDIAKVTDCISLGIYRYLPEKEKLKLSHGSMPKGRILGEIPLAGLKLDINSPLYVRHSEYLCKKGYSEGIFTKYFNLGTYYKKDLPVGYYRLRILVDQAKCRHYNIERDIDGLIKIHKIDSPTTRAIKLVLAGNQYVEEQQKKGRNLKIAMGDAVEKYYKKALELDGGLYMALIKITYYYGMIIQDRENFMKYIERTCERSATDSQMKKCYEWKEKYQSR